ncbi:carboxymuconolactone decarboxylase family protein [Lysobacter sp. cf310]|uniref:carboxymuconolactone decarboxylase family protein n=1 Tax=Lysobacter sp. cf310 TaxID=1761790 RepID=UPI0008E20E2D|nr:carboxymuconolactone decarboxylase family protein [Lysobacter sp. cf310]SFL09530.1 alkylhydroperoxidase AhpD family core domain-containing protein [Lysobacter sp. cf310]
MNDTAAARPINYQREIPDVLQAMGSVHRAMDGYGLERGLHHLVQLRASQINRCDYCIKLHTREAIADGETEERLQALADWAERADFSAREAAALAWTEALTRLQPDTELGPLRARLRQHFSDNEIGVLTSTVAMINLWNRIQVSRH